MLDVVADNATARTAEEIAARIGAYERLHGALSRHDRIIVETLAQAGEAPVGIRHPLGAGANPLDDHKTSTNRQAVAACLREYFAGTLERDRINKPPDRGSSQTGAELADRFVTKLEIGEALRHLKQRDRMLWLTVQRRFAEGLNKRAIAERWHQSPATVAKNLDSALDIIIGFIWKE